MKRAIIIHGWQEKPQGQWLPWVGKKLEEKGWKVQIPEMPNTNLPKMNEWMDTLVSLSPDKNTILIGHSLANALILKYLEKTKTKIKGVVMVAAWDWLMDDVKEEHKTFFENGFDYKKSIAKIHKLLLLIQRQIHGLRLKKLEKLQTNSMQNLLLLKMLVTLWRERVIKNSLN